MLLKAYWYDARLFLFSFSLLALATQRTPYGFGASALHISSTVEHAASSEATERPAVARGRRRLKGQQPESRKLRIIGAGHPRTGTESMVLALNELGYSAIHTRDPDDYFLGNETVRNAWLSWSTGGPVSPLVESILDRGYDATTADGPFFLASGDFMKRFPESKVILTTHPGGARGWVKSMERVFSLNQAGFRAYVDYMGRFRKCYKNMLTRALRTPSGKASPISLKAETEAVQWEDVLKSVAGIDQAAMMQRLSRWRSNETYMPLSEAQREVCIKEYESDNEKVRRSVPNSRLLEFDVAQGWGPLCKFLGVKQPSKPFPHSDWMPRDPAWQNNWKGFIGGRAPQ